MDDAFFVALVEGVSDYVDDRYGRAAAWLAGIIMLAMLVALIAGALWWLAA